MKKFTQRFFGLAVILFLGLSLSAQAPFWTEDFDGGLPADWSAVMVAGDSTPNANWFWTMQGPAGGFAINPLQSTTSNNGWMIFDSDLNCSGEQNAWLVSPKIDLSDKDLVILTWQQYYRKFGDQINVQVSLDSTIWTQFPLLTGLENNDFGDGSATGETNPQTMNLDISSVAANEPQVWFAFQFLADSTTAGDVGPGCAYSWQIDDVGLLDFDPTPATDLSLGDFFFPPLSFATPTSQIATDTMGFSADVSNVGAADVTNVVLKATVTDENGNTLFVDSVVADVIPVGTIDSTLIVPNLYPPASDVGIYTIRYDLYSLDSEDQDMGNNSATEDYIVTEDLWSKENGPTTAYRPRDGPVDYLVGNMYTTSPNWVETYYATNVDFTAATNNSDGPLSDFHTSILLLEVKEDVVAPDFSNFDDQKDYLSNPGLKIRAFELYQYQGNNFDMQTVLLNDFDEEKPGVELKPGNRYFLMASYEGNNNVVFHAFSEEINYFQISTIVYNGQWFLGGFGPEPAAVLRMTIAIDVVGVEDKLSPRQVANIFPNPVNDEFTLEVNFDKPELANVTIAHLDGRVVKMDVLKNVQHAVRQYDVSGLPAGTYLVRVTTAEGSRTQKIVVAD